MPGTGVWDSCQQFLESMEHQQQQCAPMPSPQPSCQLHQPVPPPPQQQQHHSQNQQQPGEQQAPSHVAAQPQEQWPQPLASPFAAPALQQEAPAPTSSADDACGDAPQAKMISPFGAAYLQEQAFSTGSLPSLAARLPDAKTLPSAEGPLHQPARSGAPSPPPTQQIQQEQRQQQQQLAQQLAQQQQQQQSRPPAPDPWVARQQAVSLGQLSSQQQHAALLSQPAELPRAASVPLMHQQQQQAVSLEQQLAAQQALLEQQRSAQKQWCSAAMRFIEAQQVQQQAQQAQQQAQQQMQQAQQQAQQAQQQAQQQVQQAQQQTQQAQQMDWVGGQRGQHVPLPACPHCRQLALPAADCGCVGPLSIHRTGTGNRSVHMAEASSLSRAGSSPEPSRAASHVSRGSMAGSGRVCGLDEDQQMQEVLSIARELGVLPASAAALEAQPSWIPTSLGTPLLPLGDHRLSEESAQSQLQLQQQQQQHGRQLRSHAPGLTCGHSHPPAASQLQQQLQPAPQLRREDWSAGGNAAPPALLAQRGMQQIPARQLSADQLFELAHLLQRAKAAGIQLEQLQSWQAWQAQQQQQQQQAQQEAQQQPPPQPPPPLPQQLCDMTQQLRQAVQQPQQQQPQQQQQLLPLQQVARPDMASCEQRSALLAGLQRQISAESHRTQQALQAQQTQQTQHAAFHRQQLLLLEAAQAEQRKQLVQAQQAELLQLEQARQARQAQHVWQAAEARHSAPAPLAVHPPPLFGEQQVQHQHQRSLHSQLPPQHLPTAHAAPTHPPPPPPLQQGAVSLYVQQQALLAQQRAEQQRWADAALSLLRQDR